VGKPHLCPAGEINRAAGGRIADRAGEPVYPASNHAVHALTHGIRRQLIGTGVRIGSVAPGGVLNDLWKVTDATAMAAGVAAGTGLRYEDVADTVLYVLTRPQPRQYPGAGSAGRPPSAQPIPGNKQ
jgi:NADP-dependent 3-hydroxy acid dehydrogenase YdfG